MVNFNLPIVSDYQCQCLGRVREVLDAGEKFSLVRDRGHAEEVVLQRSLVHQAGLINPPGSTSLRARGLRGYLHLIVREPKAPQVSLQKISEYKLKSVKRVSLLS